MPAVLPPFEALNRRVLRNLAFGVVAFVAAGFAAFAGFVASRDLDAVARQIVDALQAETGGQVTIGSTRTRLWPSPRVTLDAVAYHRPDGSLHLTASRAMVAISPFDVIDGRIDNPNITLHGAVIRIAAGPVETYYESPRAVAGFADTLSGLFDNQTRASSLRLAIQRGRFVFENGHAGGDLVLDPVDLRVKYNGPAGRVDVTARRISEIRPVEMTMSIPTRAHLASRDRGAAELHLSGFGSRLKFSGTLSRKPDLALSGKLETSIEDALERAIGLTAGDRRGGSDELTHISANITLDPRGGGLEGLQIRRGAGQLAGIASLRENGGRWSVSATLAGDLIDGTAAHAAMQRLKTRDGQWSPRNLDINPAPGLDLDLRLSTRAFRLGQVMLENAALSVFTRAGRAEFAIGDSRHAGGMLKARLSVVERESRQDIRLSVTGEKLDGETFLDRAFGLGRIRGLANFVLQTESFGSSVEQLVANLSGTGSLEVRNGELLGIDLNRLMARSVELRAEAALLVSLGGKTPFETLATTLAFRDGKVEPVGSTFTNGRMDGTLEGHIDLVRQQNHLSGFLRRRTPIADQPLEFFGFRIDGTLFHPLIKPDPALLTRRS